MPVAPAALRFLRVENRVLALGMLQNAKLASPRWRETLFFVLPMQRGDANSAFFNTPNVLSLLFAAAPPPI